MNLVQKALLVVAGFTPILAAVPVRAADTLVTVTGNTSAGENQPGWLFNRDTNTDTPYEFNENEFSIGEGALYVLPIGPNASDKFIAENFINTPIANVNSISYDYSIGASGDIDDDRQFYMNVYANFGVSDDLKFYDCRYNIVPTIGVVDGFTTVIFDPTQAYDVTTRGGSTPSPFPCPAVPAEMDTISAGSNIRAFALSVGDTSTDDVGLDGYLDNVVVDLDSGVTTYDFEQAPTVLTSKEACKDGGWATSEQPVFKNQGDCISHFASNGKAKGNPVAAFLSRLF